MTATKDQKLSLIALIALVVGSMVGAGVFSLPSSFARASSGLGAIIAWIIAGVGMLMLAFVFQSLLIRKPKLDSGIFAYAQAGFGKYIGFISALGFWAGSCVGNVTSLVLLQSTLGGFFPVFGDGSTLFAIAVGSIILWGFHFLVLKGLKGATSVNTIVTFAKVIPIIIFIILAFSAFKISIFSENFNNNLDLISDVTQVNPELTNSLAVQVRNTMLITVFVFLGIEGASVYSRYAKKRSDVGKATILGFLGVLCIFVLVTMLSYGILSRAELANLRQPSMAGVLELIVGHWGAIFISLGLMISVLGAYLSWILLAAEVLFTAAKEHTFPVFLAKENKHAVPSSALWATSILIQFFLLISFFSSQAFDLMLALTSALSLIPYLLVMAYAFKLAVTGESYRQNESKLRHKELIISFIALFYSAAMIYAGGLKYVLLSALIYVPGTVFYLIARKEQKEKHFKLYELLIFFILLLFAIAAVYGITKGLIII